METKIPGIKCKHAIISDACREKGDVTAFDEAAIHLLMEYKKLTSGPWPKGRGAKFHLVLTVDYSEAEDRKART